MNKLDIYTDGACLGNPGPGGYGAFIIDRENLDVRHVEGSFVKTTNNRVELVAVIEAINSLSLQERVKEITIYSDSKYVVSAVNEGWLKSWVTNNFKKKKNVDLWEKFITACSGLNINFVWIKGHEGNFYNEKCDVIANQSAKGLRGEAKIDDGYEY